jgi:hypothetical protein
MLGVLDLSIEINPLNTELNPICHLLALLGGATIVVVSRLRINATLQVANSLIVKSADRLYPRIISNKITFAFTLFVIFLNYVGKQPTRGGTPAWGLGEVLTTPPRGNPC